MNSSAADVIIVAYNSGAWLHRAVCSALAAFGVGKVIVVDNASSDQAWHGLPLDARIVIIRLPKNLGFAVGCNRGAQASNAQCLLFLNPDCVLATHDVQRLLPSLQADVGLVSAQLLNADGTPQLASLRRDPTPPRAICEALGLRHLGIHLPAPSVPGLIDVDACSGALMLISRSVFQRLGGFDEGYFLHCEDLDLCRRVRALGLRVVVDTAVRVVHDKGTSSAATPLLVRQAKYRGMLRYFDKFDAAGTPFPVRWAIYLGAWLRYQISARV